MNQSVHIFRKDARHLWPEILVSLALLGALLWVTPHNHGTPDPDVPWLYPLLGGFLKFLIPVTWLVLISRLVHDEPLVGDRQYWITRPYTWYGLLGAKLLFLVAFVYLPLFLVQAILLHHAGLHPLLAGGPFLKNFGYLTAIFILPMLALAAVTSTFIRFALSVLAAIVYLIAAITVAAFVAPSKLAVPYMGYVEGTLLVAVPLAALLLQYAYRRTALARALLIATPAVAFLLILATPAATLIGHEYATALPLHGTFDPNPGYQVTEPGEPAIARGKVLLQLPVVIGGLPMRSALQSQHVIVTLDGVAGAAGPAVHYNSGWSETVSSLNPGPRPSRLLLTLPADVYNRVKDTPVTLHVTLGVEQLEAGTPYTITATAAPFPIPASGACRVDAETGSLDCAFPFSNSKPIGITGAAVTGTCSNPSPSTPASSGLAASIPTPEFDPVSSQQARFGVLTDGSANLCPGAKLDFAVARTTAKGSVTIDIPAITLSSYAMRITAPPRPQVQ